MIDNNEVISGRGKYEVIELNKHMLGENITAILIKSITKNLSTGNEKTTWFLKNIEKTTETVSD